MHNSFLPKGAMSEIAPFGGNNHFIQEDSTLHNFDTLLISPKKKIANKKEE